MQIKKNARDRYWQTAGDRVFLYVRCLNFPAAQAFELALRALNEAEQNILKKDVRDSPVAEAMQALHELLWKQQFEMPSGQNFVSYMCERERMQETETDSRVLCGERSGSRAIIVPMPPIRRRHMTPEELSPTNVRALLEYFTRRFKKHSGK